MLEELVLGIDIGTFSTHAAVEENGETKVIFGEDGFYSMASFVYFDENGEPLVGNKAKDISFKNPSSGIYDFQRFIGKTYKEYLQIEKQACYPFKVEHTNRNNKLRIKIQNQNNKKELTVEDIIEFILTNIKKRAETVLKREVVKAVITVPYQFDENQRKSLEKSCKSAGLQLLDILDESTAAIIGSDLNKKHKTAKILIFDFGANLKISIADINNTKIDIIGYNNLNFIADKINNKVAELLLNEFKKESGFDIPKKSTNEGFKRILKRAEIVKTQLSGTSTIEIDLHKLYHDEDLECVISRNEFERVSKTILDKCVLQVQELLKKYNVDKNKINEILLIGGSSRILYLRNQLKNYFGKQFITSNDPEEVIATGAAKYGLYLNKSIEQYQNEKYVNKKQNSIEQAPEIILKPFEQDEKYLGKNTQEKEQRKTAPKNKKAAKYPEKSKKSKSPNIFDTLPLTIGLYRYGIMEEIMPKNSKNGSTCIKQFFISKSASVSFHIYFGDRPICVDNTKLGVFTLKGFDPKTKDHKIVTVKFVFENGNLQINATENHTLIYKGNINLSNFFNKNLVDKSTREAEQYKKEDKEKLKKALILRKFYFDKLDEMNNLLLELKNNKNQCKHICSSILVLNKEIGEVNFNNNNLELKIKSVQSFYNTLCKQND